MTDETDLHRARQEVQMQCVIDALRGRIDVMDERIKRLDSLPYLENDILSARTRIRMLTRWVVGLTVATTIAVVVSALAVIL